MLVKIAHIIFSIFIVTAVYIIRPSLLGFLRCIFLYGPVFTGMLQILALASLQTENVLWLGFNLVIFML